MHLKSSSPTLAFLSARQNTEIGYVGGLLILTLNGRPVEFHCTLPVRPTKAQEILFGSTLDEYFCSDLIGKALLSRVKHSPVCILTDVLPVLSIRNGIETPFAVILSPEASIETSRFEKPSRSWVETIAFEVASRRLLASASTNDVNAIQNLWNDLQPTLDIYEPFSRIDEALEEAHPIVKAA